MPQGRKKSAVDIFEQEQRKPSAVDIFEQGQAAPQPPAQPPVGAAESFRQEVAGGVLEQGIKPAVTLYDAIKSAAGGDFQPLLDMAERTGRGLLETPLGTGIEKPIQQAQAPRMAELRARAEARLPEQVRSMEAGYRQEAAKPRTRAGKVAGVAGQVVGSVAPAALTGVLTGSVPAMGAVTGLQSAAEPENLAANVAAATIPIPIGQALAPILRRIRGARSVESAAGEAAGFQGGAPQPSPTLAKAIGENAFDDTKVAVKDLGLEHVPQPNRPANASPVRRDLPVEDITLSRDNLSRGRMFQAQEALEGGVKAEGETFTTPGGNQRAVEPIQVVPDPKNPGKFIVQGDGNHRVALLKLQGNTDLIPVKSFETEAQSAVVNEATASLRENYYNPPMKMPELGEGGFEEPGLTASYGAPKRYAGASGPRISQYGIVEGSPLEQAAMKGGKVSETLGPDAESQLAAESGTMGAPTEKRYVTDTITTLRKAGLLTAPTTHMRNVGATGAFQISEELARVPSVIADLAASVFTGRRSISGPSLTAMARSGIEAATNGLKDAWQIIKNGATEQELARLQLPKEANTGNAILDGYANFVFRSLTAEDKLFRTYAMTRALEDRAATLAKNELRQGAITQGQYGDRVRELASAPPADMQAAAALDAEIATFNNDNLISGALGKARQYLNTQPGGKLLNFAIDTVAPFTKTPTNIIMRMLDYSPVGLGKVGVNLYKLSKGVANEAFTDAEQRAFAQAFGRASLGSGLIALGWKLYDWGVMTGVGEDEPSKLTRDKAAGRPPGSIKIGDNWLQVTGFSPLGNLMALGASLAREIEEPRKQAGQAGKAALKAGVEVFGDQPLTQASKQLTDLVSNPSQAAGNLLGSFIPTGVGNIAQTIDQTPRQAQGFLPQIEKRLPFVSQNLPVATDALGRPLQDFGFGAIDPTKTTLSREDQVPILKELVRLDMGFSRINKKPDEADDAYRARVQRFGSLYQQFAPDLLSDPLYRRATDEDKKKALDSLSSRAKAQVADEIANGPRAAPPRYRLDPRDIMQSILLREREKQFEQQHQPPK